MTGEFVVLLVAKSIVAATVALGGTVLAQARAVIECDPQAPICLGAQREG